MKRAESRSVRAGWGPAGRSQQPCIGLRGWSYVLAVAAAGALHRTRSHVSTRGVRVWERRDSPPDAPGASRRAYAARRPRLQGAAAELSSSRRQVLELEAYACRADLRELWHKLMTELLLARPEDPLVFMAQLLVKEQAARERRAS